MTVDDRLSRHPRPDPRPRRGDDRRGSRPAVEDPGGGDAAVDAGGARLRRAAGVAGLVTPVALLLVALALAAVAAVAVGPGDSDGPSRTSGARSSTSATRPPQHDVHRADGRPTADARGPRSGSRARRPRRCGSPPTARGAWSTARRARLRPVSAADERAWRAAGSPDLEALTATRPDRRLRPTTARASCRRACSASRTWTRSSRARPAVGLRSSRASCATSCASAAEEPPRTARHRSRLGHGRRTLLAHPPSTRELRAALIEIVRHLAGARALGERHRLGGPHGPRLPAAGRHGRRPGDRLRPRDRPRCWRAGRCAGRRSSGARPTRSPS